MDLKIRLRRNRSSNWIRRIVGENTISTADLILPLFICGGENTVEEISSLPNIKRYSVDLIARQAVLAEELGIPAVALFPATPKDLRSEDAAEAFNPENLICKAIKAIKAKTKELGVITDVALDPYTAHGHDGILIDGDIANDETVEVLCQQALVQARAGADVIAPSDMMDGRVARIRETLDSNGFQSVKIMSYAAKYASSFYGPFRDAVDSAGVLKGDKKTYQMDPANINEALREVALDIEEGADIVIVKPGMPYLDVVHAVKSEFGVPTVAYHVSGEYAMLKAAAENGWLDYDKTIMESMMSFKRAGADAVITYAAIDIARILEGK